MERLLEIMARLRDPAGGCPWDVAQSFATIAPFTIEEAYEVADAVERNDMTALKSELGDLLLQVVFHAQMAREAGIFDFNAVAKSISDKMIERHPHVFGQERIGTAEAQTAAWEERKAAERAAAGDAGALDGVAAGLPALIRAMKLQQRAARVGFDWRQPAEVLPKIGEELSEIANELSGAGAQHRLHDEVGDLLFTCINLARHLKVDPESALRHANAKFERRFRRVEALLARQGRKLGGTGLDELEALWQRVKTEDENGAAQRPSRSQGDG